MSIRPVPSDQNFWLRHCRPTFNYQTSNSTTIHRFIDEFLIIRYLAWIVTLIPLHGLQKVLSYGADRVIVAGNWPFGCFPVYLTIFQTDDASAYDENRCLKKLNDLSMYYNDQLQNAIQELKKEFPNAFIAYGDYYNAFLWLLNNASALGKSLPSFNREEKILLIF